jgi:hypothetical protein
MGGTPARDGLVSAEDIRPRPAGGLLEAAARAGAVEG